ncbi:MAG: hypothetical protein ACLUN9_15305, partial [Enterocloster aldenensis]
FVLHTNILLNFVIKLTLPDWEGEYQERGGDKKRYIVSEKDEELSGGKSAGTGCDQRTLFSHDRLL